MKGQSTGFGALVLFIAGVLTAAAAAYAITVSTTSAQSHAAVAARQAEQTSGTTFQFVRVLGDANTTLGEIESLEIFVRLAPGSQPINLNQTPLVIISNYGETEFTYGGAESSTAPADLTYNGEYYLYLNDSNDVSGMLVNGYVGPGDTAALAVALGPYNLTSSEYAEVMLLPPNGEPAEVSFVAPSAIIYPVEVLY